MKKTIKMAALTLLVSLATTGNVWASVIYEETNIFSGVDSFSDTFGVLDAGNYTATLSDLSITDLDALFASILSPTSTVLGTVSAPGSSGSFTFDTTPGIHTINVFASAAPGTNLGIWGVQVKHSAVPEPTAVALFGIGLAGIGFAKKRKNSA